MSETFVEAPATSVPALPVAGSTNKYLWRMVAAEKAPIDTTSLRRSSRSTKYDGFRIPQCTDMKKGQSRVKQRGEPSVICSSKATAPCANLLTSATPATGDQVPPPIPMPQLQFVGTTLYGIPPDDLSSQKLLEGDQGEADLSLH